MSRGEGKSLRVNIPGRSYRIEVGAGIISGADARIASVARGTRMLVVADGNAARLHGSRLRRILARRYDLHFVILSPGERSKSLARAASLYEECRRHALTRQDLVVAFGGGVTGDLAGHVAATYLRGLDLVMIPTTLLAQVDSSVGGKVGVNFNGIKNLIGAFHQPRLVLSDTDFLATLPPREIRSALAEVVKCGMIGSRGLLGRLERRLPEALAGDAAVLADLVLTCCRLKARIVERDESESGVRAHLNYGHTIGHALEAAAAGRLRHGEAVALGMRGAAEIAVRMGHITEADRIRQNRLLDRIGLPGAVPGLPLEDVLAKLKWDKKVQGSESRFVLTRGIGSATLAPPVERSLIRQAVNGLLAEKPLRRK